MRTLPDAYHPYFSPEVIISNTRKVFHQIPKHQEVGLKMRHSQAFLKQLQSVLVSDETLFPLFDITSQSINNS